MEAHRSKGALPTGAAIAVAAGLVVSAAVLGQRLWFFSDDWNIYAQYHSGNLTEPFNGHLSAVPAGLYQGLFHTLGVGSYLPYRILGLTSLAVLAFWVARHVRRCTGPWLAVLAVAAVLWNSAGTTNVMFPFLMNFSLPIAALIAMWWHLDALREGTATRDLVWLGVWAALALATSGLGVVAVGAVGVEMLLRRVSWRTWLAVGLPAGVWFIWWLAHRGANDVSTDMTQVLPYLARMLWAGTTSLAAGWAPGGLVLGALLVYLTAASAATKRALDPRLASALGAAFAFAGLTALTRQDTVPPIPPDELRYGWTIGAYFVLAAVAAWSTIRPSQLVPDPTARGTAESRGFVAHLLDAPSWVRTATAAVAVAVLAAGGIRLLGDMAEWSDVVAEAAPGLRSNIYAAEAAGRDRLDPEAVIRPLSFVPVEAGDYLDAVADVGSPLAGSPLGEIGGRSDQRRAADDLFFSAVRPELATEPVPAGERECVESLEAAPGTRVYVQSRPASGSDALAEPVLAISRFGSEPALELPVPPGIVLYTLTLPEDAPVGTEAVVPYRIHGSAEVTLCVDASPPGP